MTRLVYTQRVFMDLDQYTTSFWTRASALVIFPARFTEARLKSKGIFSRQPLSPTTTGPSMVSLRRARVSTLPSAVRLCPRTEER